MKPEEQIAAAFLERCYRQQPHYEPLGRDKPPDFAIERTAFEVRRLNQYFVYEDGRKEGLEQIAVPLSRRLARAFDQVPYDETRGTFWWILRFRRPLEVEPRLIIRDLTGLLRDYYAGQSKESKEFSAHAVTIEIIPANQQHGKAFLPFMSLDADSGGFIGRLYQENIEHALEEKIAKTQTIVDRFERWVLVLVDYILSGIAVSDEIGQPRFDLQHFTSILIIDENGQLTLDLPTGSFRALRPAEAG